MVDFTTSAISWGFTAAGWLLSPVLSRFLNKCFDALGMDPPPKFQSKKKTLLAKLEQLQTILLPKLLILTDAAEKSNYRPDLATWIQKLKSAFYEAEHVLGLVEYEHLEKKVNSLFPSNSKFNLKILKAKLPKLSSEKKNLIESLENLEKVVTEGMEFVSLLNLSSSSVNNSTWSDNKQYRVTISTPDSTVIGREKDRDYILKLLEQDSSKSGKLYSVIAIWGMGGLGKTTLAQFVCEDVKRKKWFDHVMWVHVSENFNIRAIMKKMWESVTLATCPNYENLDVLISQLCNILKDKKYLLVFDDVWCNKGVSQQELDQLFVPLNCGNRGSKILVTTRNEDAARALGAENLIKLRELDDDEFLSLFMIRALPDGEVDEHIAERLQKIGMKIVEKLCRSPMAAVTVAAQLRRRPDPDFWMIMSNKKLLNDVMGAVYLSYQNLRPALQRCFAFCSLFPKGYWFDQDDLVNLWIAEGFIETEHNNEHMKDVGNQYFLELISSSFFQLQKNSNHYYSMHDLIHDLAQNVSEGECFRIETSEEDEIPTQTRHLYVWGDMLQKYMEKICKIKDLRTIMSFCNFESKDYWREVDLDALFTDLRKLYVVDIQHNIKSLPKSVIQLKNLRYLRIDSVVDVIPYSALVIPDSVLVIPDSVLKSFNRLYQLRVLFIRGKSHSDRIEIPDVGKLILLHNLMEFHVRKRRGLELKQLEHLRDLSGSLSIYGLHNVERKEEAHQAKLFEKKGLRDLCFYWNESKDVLRDDDVEILDALCPPPHIKELVIDGYRSKRLPSWILENNDNIRTHLKNLTLTNCSVLEALPRIDELLNLLSLTISHLPSLRSWVPPPINLTRLKISGCLSLAFAVKEDLETLTSVASSIDHECDCNCTSLGCQFKCTQEIVKHLGGDKDEQELSSISNDLNGCLEKTAIGEFKEICGYLYLPPALKDLSIDSWIITNRVLAGSLQGLNSLTFLKLENINTITCIMDDVLCFLTSLKKLEISECLLLTSIDGWDTHGTLEVLEIFKCPDLTLKASVVEESCSTVEQTSPSCKRKTTSCVLNEVNLAQCSPLDDCFQNLVSLKSLEVRHCPTIENPQISHLKSLKYLWFIHCSNLISLRGLSELNHLNQLDIRECEKVECYSDADKLPWLRYLLVSKLSLVEQVIIRDGLSSLIFLEFSKAKEEYFSQQDCEVLCCLSSLERIRFEGCEIRMLPSLLGLHYLREVEIIFCKNLTSLSELPPSVQTISIAHCNEVFTKSCKDRNHPNCQKISHIPKKHIRL